MFVKYRNFNFVSRDEMKTNSFLKEYIVRGTVDKVVKLPFCSEKITTVNIFLTGMFWRFESDASYCTTSIENLIKVWEVKNATSLSPIGSK